MSSSPALPFKGVPFYMNGKDYFIPSLSLAQFEANYELLTEPVGDVDVTNLSSQFRKFVPIILAAINRNYPEVTYEDLFQWIDLASFREVLLAVQAASGMKAAKPGE